MDCHKKDSFKDKWIEQIVKSKKKNLKKAPDSKGLSHKWLVQLNKFKACLVYIRTFNLLLWNAET